MFVYAGLDLCQFSLGNCFRMLEVKTQPVWGNQRTGLPGVVAENTVQFGVQQVGGGVVPDDILSPLLSTIMVRIDHRP